MACVTHLGRRSSDHHVRPAVVWRASGHSGGQGDCVGVGDGLPGLVLVRDSKWADGPVVTFSPGGAGGVFVSSRGCRRPRATSPR
ncbi:DUF397 domain-containing protein [Streptomyces griseoviridis]|uniref:DUF397 domain-containing protein n=1 Tax=Streptomyces griseoviridis TaxID=45398 RepID=UPI00167C029A|nr:DUF397 domain-containing protein [Streptomyces griseoviridis]